MMRRVYTASRRFDKMRNLCVMVMVMVVFVFYFIYRYLFEAIFPSFVGTPMMILFILFGAVVTKATLYFSDKIKSSIRYEIGENCLIVGTGKNVRRYPWANFTAIRYEKFKVRDLMPASFEVGGETILLNQYVDEIYDLTQQIITHVGPKVPVDKEITDRINAMR